jgi:hypothetical protein
VLTIGGNDVRFSDVLTVCFFNRCTDPDFHYNNDPDPYTTTVHNSILNLKPALRSTYERIREVAPHATIVVLGYPLLFPDTYSMVHCSNEDSFSAYVDSYLWLNGEGLVLNRVIGEAALEAGVEVVTDTLSSFNGHQHCSTGTNESNEWLRGLTFHSGTFGNPVPDSRSFHPSALGQGGDPWVTPAPMTGYTAIVNDYLRNRPT